jgi:pSer/pThr/pTyr-binding forkhead associated (FHA) protein
MDQFLEACEADSALRLEVTDLRISKTSRYVFSQPYVVIGREEGAGLVLEDPQVSRRHAYFQIVRGRIFCVDLGSRAGTRWGSTSERAGWISPDQPVTIGPYLIRPCDDGPVRDQVPLVDVDLELWDGTVHRTHWRVERVLALVGRSSACNLQLANPNVPRFFCSLLRTPTSAWVVDLEGAGIVINGSRVQYAKVDNGDELEIGSYKIRFQCGKLPALRVVRDPESSVRGGMAALPHNGNGLGRFTDRQLATRPSPVAGASPGPPSLSAPMSISAAGSGSAESLLFDLRHHLAQGPPQVSDQLSQSMMMMAQAFGVLFQEQMHLIREELDQIRQLTRELETLRTRLQSPELVRVDAPELAPPSDKAAGVNKPRLAQVGETGPSAAAKDPAKIDPKELQSQEELNNLHDMLCQRIAAFQEERDSRWQKILGAVLGR